jgi:hypothetical protein
MSKETPDDYPHRVTRSIGASEFPLLATTKVLAVRYRVSPRCIQNWTAKKILPVLKIGRAVRFNIAACDRALAKFERKAAG